MSTAVKHVFHLALSAVSAQGRWLLADSDLKSVVASIAWSDPEATGLSTQTDNQLDALLSLAKIDLSHIEKLFAVVGPGAFTGLRMSSAYMQGLACALNIPLVAVPTFDLLGQEFFIPLRHQQSRNLDLNAALANGIEFLHLQSPTLNPLAIPNAASLVYGLSDRPLWPSAEELLRGMQKNQLSTAAVEINYGLEPKISGKRA